MRPTPSLVIPEWKAHRIISNLFVGICDTHEKLAIAVEIVDMTNDRLLDKACDIQLFAPEARVIGPGPSPVIDALMYLGFGTRFYRSPTSKDPLLFKAWIYAGALATPSL